MAIELRDARPEDADEIAALHLRCWRHNYKGLMDQAALDGIDDKVWAERRHKRLGNLTTGNKLLVACEGKRILGFCDAGPSRHSEIAPVEVYAMYVDPAAQGKGVGALLMRGMLDFLKTDQGQAKVMVKTLLTNPQSRKFYEKLGGKFIGESSFDFVGKKYPEAIYVYD
ncbi:MAG TPA: GNAT family N-acetyltransferase [Bdellovibrionota bacterium]|jgi:GNAT superfamily N-acetyltransferase